MSTEMQKFATQADASVLAEIRDIASKEGKQLQTIVDEALRDLIEKRKSGNVRPKVMAAFGESLAKYEVLYQKLAK